MECAYKFRLYPTDDQKQIIDKSFEGLRWVYNYYLDKTIKAYEDDKTVLGYYAFANDIPILKLDHEFLKEIDSTAIQQSLKNLDVAFKNFFKRRAGYPKHKEETYYDSYKTTSAKFIKETNGKYIQLPKLGRVKIRGSLTPDGRIISATVRKESSGKYYCSLCCTDVVKEEFEKTGKSIGLDLGIKNFIVRSDGEKIDNPRYLAKSLDRLAKLQQILSRKEKGSNNYEKARINVAKLQEYIVNQRRDYLQKLSTSLIKEFDIICIEDLNIKDMQQNHLLSRNIMDSSWGEFVRELQYKAEWYGKEVRKVDRFFASSQICSCCGTQHKITKDLNVREWTCPDCGAKLDRDINAAINILNAGLNQ